MSIAVVDSSTKLVHVVPLKRGGDATISEFIRAVEVQLMETALGGQCIRVLCAAVGDSCINICDKLRTVLYYSLDGKPWYIKTGVFSSSHSDVCVKDLNSEFGNEATIKVDLDKSLVKDLKRKFAKMTLTPFTSLHLMIDKKELENDKRLSQYNLDGCCIVPCVPGDRMMNLRVPLIHIPENYDESKAVNGHSAKSSPVWRGAALGLWLEGECVNKICVAFSKQVVINLGFTDLDIVSERHMCKSKCPMCYEKVIPTKFGINRCNWNTVGLKTLHLGQQRPEVVREEWQQQQEGYSCFKLNKDIWLKFKITCRELNGSSYCVYCMNKMASGCSRVGPCGHVAHAGCFENGEACLICIGEQNMTPFQCNF